MSLKPQESSTFCVILSTTNNQDNAKRIAELLVSRRLAACVQISTVLSTYRWEGEIHKDDEYLLLIKTAAHLYPLVQAAILENNSYETHEIIKIPIQGGLDRYLAWVEENTTK
jgi:periplasmic divalent cation tolerance protein